jgi:hypothetical protein
MTDAESAISVLEGNVAINSEALNDRVTISAFQAAVGSLGEEDLALANRISTLEGQLGETGSVSEAIEAAKQAAIDAAAADATSKANTAEANAIAKANELNGAMDTRMQAVEAASATHALKTEVEAVSTALEEYKTAHKDDYTNAQIDAAIKVNTDAIAAFVECSEEEINALFA